MIIDIISDLHGHKPHLEGGDLLIICGDLTARDTNDNWVEFETGLFDQKYKNKIIIAGNHDNFLGSMDEHRMWKYWDKIPHVTYLSDSGTEFEGLKFFGTPWTKTFPGINPMCCAFTCDTEEELYDKFVQIPDDIDILISHGPMYGILDEVMDMSVGFENEYKRHCGSTALREAVDRVKPKLFVFGHIHEQGGKQVIYKHGGYGDENNTLCVNASYVNEYYQPVNKVMRIEL